MHILLHFVIKKVLIGQKRNCKMIIFCVFIAFEFLLKWFALIFFVHFHKNIIVALVFSVLPIQQWKFHVSIWHWNSCKKFNFFNSTLRDKSSSHTPPQPNLKIHISKNKWTVHFFQTIWWCWMKKIWSEQLHAIDGAESKQFWVDKC